MLLKLGAYLENNLASKKKWKGWWQCGERYMLSTWGFGCAHGRVGGSSSKGVLEVCWQTFCCNSGRNELPSVLFLSPSPQVITAVSPQSTGPPLLQHALLGRSPPTSSPSTSSASKVATMPPFSWLYLLCGSIHPFSDAQMEGPIRDPVQSRVLGYESARL